MPHMRFLVAGGIMILAVCFLMFSGVTNSMVYYYSISELRANAASLEGRGVRVSGHVSPGTIRKQTGSRIEFEAYEKDSGHTLSVVYEGIVPDTFKDGAEVVVEGNYDQQSRRFHANTLLAKCPSKYEEQGQDEYQQPLSSNDLVPSR